MTEQNLRPCPFCGNLKDLIIYEHPPYWAVEDAETEYSVSCHNCISGQLDTWNNRPLEDALEAYIAALEAENRALRHALELRECEEKQRWRVVADGELPEVYRDEDGEFIRFLVCEGDGDYLFIAMYNGINWHAGIFVPDITHWMPLPEPPIVCGKESEE